MKLQELRPEDVTIYCDMDGVLVNFIGGVKEILGLNDYSEHRYETDRKYRSMLWKIMNAYQKREGDFWLKLRPMDDAQQLWKFISRYKVEILTATGTSGHETTAKQKRIWIPQHIADVKVNVVKSASEKAQFASPNAILIDDKSKAINPFKQAGGIGVLHTTATSTINKLRQLGL